MRKCREIVEILASGESLSFFGRMELRLHLLMCRHCSQFASHLRIMKESFVKLFRKITDVDRKTIDELENDILRKLDK